MLYIVLLIFRILMFLNHFSDFGRGSDSQGGGKASIKTSIWFMQVMKLGVANTSAGEQPTFTMHYWLKEKKQKSKYILIFCFQNYSDLKTIYFMQGRLYLIQSMQYLNLLQRNQI